MKISNEMTNTSNRSSVCIWATHYALKYTLACYLVVNHNWPTTSAAHNCIGKNRQEQKLKTKSTVFKLTIAGPVAISPPQFWVLSVTPDSLIRPIAILTNRVEH